MYNEPAVLALEPEEGFVETPQIKGIITRALAYLQAGYPVHFSGPAGTGKTTLAMHMASQLGRPTMLIFGDDEFGSSDLIGGQFGYRKRRVVDNFISRVLKTDEDVMARWVDNRLTEACKNGFTLIYDEFNRSRPEANNALLSVLEEHLLVRPVVSGEEYLMVDPNFRAIFTSNPAEYVGIHKTQDALRDRMVTIHLDHFDKETEASITRSRSDVSEHDAERIVNIVRSLRRSNPYRSGPGIRACIMIGKVSRLREAKVKADDPAFREICLDVLTAETNGRGEQRAGKRRAVSVIEDLIKKHAGRP